MPTPILATKLYIPAPRSGVVHRPHLIERLNEGMHRKLTLICAPAGFGKTTLVSAWVAGCARPVAWLSLDEGDSDPTRLLTYLISALRSIVPNIGEGVLSQLESPQPPDSAAVLTTLLNEITTAMPGDFVLVLDDYHVIDAKAKVPAIWSGAQSQGVDQALAFLLEHLPPQIHLVMATREDPHLPLARLRARDQLTELRATDLRFTNSEAAGFLNQAMGLSLSPEDIDALEDRTEGWIAGLQLAALSLQGHKDTAGFIKSFTGSHHFVLDYLVEEVLHRQSESVQTFLLRTSILDRMCGSLCDAVLPGAVAPGRSGQETLEYLEHASLFIVPLDNERRWYRYHHLFADLLRQRFQRLHQNTHSSTLPPEDALDELHIRASQWYEDNDLEIEAFHHAAAANDVERAERLIQGAGIPLYFRGTVVPVLSWLESLPRSVLDATPSLWVMSASAQLQVDHTLVEQKLQAAEAAIALQTTLHGAEPDGRTRDLIGRIASMRATVAVVEHDVEAIIAQSRRALEYLHPDNLHVRTATTWSLGHAYQLQGDRAAASQAYNEVISISKLIGDSVYTIAATINLGQVQEADNQLHLAATTYKRVLQMAGDPPQPITCEAHLGLARIYYQWNDLDAAQEHGEECIQQTRHIAIENVDTIASCKVMLARLRLARRDLPGAVAMLAEAEGFARRNNFPFRMPDVATSKVLALLRHGDLAAAAHLAETYELSLSEARILLAQGNPSAAMAVLEAHRHEAESKGWADERLKAMVLQVVALHEHGEKDKAAQLLGEALVLTEPGGFIRIFVDEGAPIAALLQAVAKPGFPDSAREGITTNYVERILAAFGAFEEASQAQGKTRITQLLAEPLSERELEVLRLLGAELNGPEVARELMVSLSTMRTHTRSIYSKLGVNSRRAAVRRAAELHLL